MNEKEILEHIKRLKNGRAATSDANQIELIDLGLSKYRQMLANLANLEKKSDPQPEQRTQDIPKATEETEKPGQPRYILNIGERGGKTARAKQWEAEQVPVTLGQLDFKPGTNETTTLDIPMVNGEVFTATYGTVKARARQYFANVLLTEAFLEKRYAAVMQLSMYKNLVRLVKGWGVLKTLDKDNPEYPEVKDIFRIQKQTRQDRINQAQLLLGMVLESIERGKE